MPKGNIKSSPYDGWHGNEPTTKMFCIICFTQTTHVEKRKSKSWTDFICVHCSTVKEIKV